MWSSRRDTAELYPIIVAECFQVLFTVLAKEVLLEAVELDTGSSEIFRYEKQNASTKE